MIRHTVVFRLKHEQESQKEKDFLRHAKKLASISTVRKFERLRQVSSKNDFSFSLSMEFDSQADYDFYCGHPDHQDFVQKYWIPEVEDFMEIDYVEL